MAGKMGFRAVILFGNPAYYGRFGFQDAALYGISTAEGENFDAFMVKGLAPGNLKGIRDRFFADGAFHVDEEALSNFDRAFPPKEKRVTDTQLK